MKWPFLQFQGKELQCWHDPDKLDEIFCTKLETISQSLALDLTGDFNLSDVNWKYGTAQRKRSGRFLRQLVSGATRGGNDEMTQDVGEVRRRISRTASLDFWGTDIGLLRSLVERVP